MQHFINFLKPARLLNFKITVKNEWPILTSSLPLPDLSLLKLSSHDLTKIYYLHISLPPFEILTFEFHFANLFNT